jgi:transglutaminase-like putative cysteine protease
MILDYYNTSGNKADFAKMKPWVAVMYTGTAGLEQYLVATANCQSNNPTIIAYTNGIVGNTTDPYEKAVKIFNWVRDCVEYSFYYNTTKGALGVLNDGNGNCCDIAHLIVAFSRAAGLAARYEHGTCNFASGTYGHVWAQIYVGAWFNADGSNNCNEFGVINNWDTANYIHRGYYASLPF